jgi:hypothetical protein
MSGSERIVTEIIIDTSTVTRSAAEVAAAMAVAQKATDDYLKKLDRNTAAQKAAAESGTALAGTLGANSRGYKQLAGDADTYLSRLDPGIAAQKSLQKEIDGVSRALLGLGRQYQSQDLGKGIEASRALENGTRLLKERTLELTTALNGLKAGTLGAADAVTVLKTANERAADSAKPMVASTDAMRIKYDEVYRISKQYETAVNAIIQAENDKTISSTLATQALEKERLAMEANIAAADKLAASKLGPDPAAMAAANAKLLSSIDPLTAAWQKYQAELTKIADVESKVAGSTNIANAARTRALDTYQKEADAIIGVGKGHVDLKKSVDEGTASVGQMKFANQQLTVQFSQMVSGIATGQPILMTLIQQGHQVADVMWASGISMKEMAGGALKILQGAFAALTSPIGLLVTGITAVIGTMAALSVSAESQNRSFNELKVTLSATRGDYAAVADGIEKDSRRIAASLGLSRDEATKTMGAIAALPLPAGLNSSLEDLTRTAANLGTVLGTGLAGGLKDVTAALQDPTKAAMAFANTAGGLRTLSGALLRNISDLQAAGDKVGATNVLLLAMKQASELAEAEGLTPLQKAMKALNEEFVKGSTNGKNFFKDLGEGINTAVVGAVTALKDLVATINKLYELADKLPKGTVGAAASLIPGVGPLIAGYTTGSALYDTLFNRGNGTGGLVGTPSTQTQALVAKWQQDPMAVRSALSSSNAIGIGQLLPGTASDLGVNPMVPFENVRGMMTYIQQLSKTFSTQPDIAAHYLTGPAGAGLGSTAGTKYAREVGGQNASAVPKETADMIEYWGNALGMSREMIDFGKRIAMQENRGVQGPVSVMRPYIDPAARSSVGGAVVTKTDINPATGKPRTGANEDVVAGKAQVDAYTAGITALRKEQEQLDKALEAGAVTEKGHATRTAQITLEIARLTDKTMEANRASGQAIDVSKQLTEADATMLRNRQAMEDQMRNDPTITQEQAKKRLAVQEAEMAATYNRTVIDLDKKLKAQDEEAIATAKGTAETARAAAAQQAKNEADKSFVSNSPAHAAAVENLTNKYLEQASGAQKVAAAKEGVANQETIKVLNAETEALHMQTDVGALYVQHVKDKIAVDKEYYGLAPEKRANILKERDAIAALNQELNNQRAIGQYLAGQFDTMFSTIGTAITNAFTQGQGAAVNWGNVTKAVVTQVKQAFLQLAIINPIKQMVFGSSIASAPTLLNVLGYLGGGGTGGGLSLGGSGLSLGGGGVSGGTGPTGSSGGMGSLLGTGSSLLSGGSTIYKALGLDFLSSSTGGVSSLSSLANTPLSALFSSSGGGAYLGAGQFGPVTSGLPAGGAGLPAAAGTLAGAVGGIGAGFTVGTLAGNEIQSMRGTTGPAPMIGAGLGAGLMVAGAALAPETFGMSLLLAGLIGGAAGGAAGGFIGPKKASPYSSTLISLTDGHAAVGATYGQGFDTAAEHQQALTDVQQLNDYIDAVSLKLTSLGGVGQLGQNTPGGYPDPSKFTDLKAGFSQLRFSATDPVLNQYLQGRGFSDSDALKKAISDYSTLVSGTIPTLLNYGKVTGTVNDEIKTLNDTFNAAIATANEYGVATQDLTAAQAAGEAKIRDIANKQINDFDTTLRLRKMVAQGADPQTIELQSFDQSARQQRDAFKEQMTGLFGDAFTSSQYYADQMALLEDTLGAERLAIVKKYADLMVAQEKQIRTFDEDLAVRLSNATPGDARGKELFAFDVGAQRQRTSFDEQLVGIYGDAFRNTAAYADQMKLLENVLGAERLQIVKKYADAMIEAEKQIRSFDEDLTVRISNATSGDAMGKELFAFDVNAQRQRVAFNDQLVGIYGDSFKTTVAYADQMALLEQALGAERLQIQQKYADQIAQQTEAANSKAADAITALVNYATGLQTSNASPLSPQDQLALARSQFNAVGGAAAAGDYTSIQKLQGYAQSFLDASRVVYGSGSDYVSDFKRVLEVLGQVADVTPETLTASVLRTETRTQTAELVEVLEQLKAAVDTVTTQLRQNATAPARIAA